LSHLRATEPDTFSQVVSYHYLDTLAEPGTPLTSPVVSYQYYDWPGDENLTFQTSPNVSYYFDGAPQILTQPLAQVLRTGQTATFSVNADGSLPLSYQWRLNGVNLTGGTGPTIAIDDLEPGDSGSYSVAVQNAHGTAVSTDANLIVYLPPPNPLPTLPSMTTAGSTPPVAVTVPPPPPGSLKVFNTSGQLVDPAGAIDPNKKTIVMTHGWLSSPSAWPTAMRLALKDAGHGANANIVVWDWSTNASEVRLWKAAGYTPKEGEALALALMSGSALGPNYSQPIHFIGHSLGTLVNCRAADYLHGDGKNSPAKSPGSYLPSKTHMTLFDEAELAVPVNGAQVALDVLLGKSSLTNGQGSSSPAKVIPEQAEFIDNYVGEVGLLHSRAANVLLWRRIAVPGISDFIGAGLHGYSYDWYRRSIVPPAASALGLGGKRMGFFWSFERGTIPGVSVPEEETFFLQSLDPSASALAVTELDDDAAQLISRHRVSAYIGLQAYQSVVYPTYQAYKGLSLVGNAIEGVYLDGIQYAGNMVANFAETFTAPTGQPVYSGVAGSTPAYFIEPGQSPPNTFQAGWNLQFTIQPGAPQPQHLQIPIRANAGAVAATNTVYTIIPIHVPTEAVGVSFEYKIHGAADDDFMAMGIGQENNYSMEARYVEDGQWNGTPVIQVSDVRNQDVDLIFALTGANGPPSGTLSIRNIQFFVPPKPQLDLQIAGPQLTALWPLSALDWTLESTTNLSDPNSWQPVNVAPLDGDYFHTHTFDISTTGRAFFRLKK
jgi:Immunoglobulin I-set domain/Lipase